MKKNILSVFLILISLILISLGLYYFLKIPLINSFRIVFGSLYLLFLPGFILTYIFFPKTKEFSKERQKNSIDWIERIALSFGLSIAIVPLTVFYLNLLGIKITFINTFLIILAIVIILSIILAVRLKRFNRNDIYH